MRPRNRAPYDAARMKCINCSSSADGYTVVPGIGELGEIRFYCDRCARNHRVKMRYWDGRDLRGEGESGDPGLEESFRSLIFSFHDLLRLRREDLEAVLAWVEDAELALAMTGAEAALVRRILETLPPPRAARVKELMGRKDNRGTEAASTPESAQDLVVSLVRRL